MPRKTKQDDGVVINFPSEEERVAIKTQKIESESTDGYEEEYDPYVDPLLKEIQVTVLELLDDAGVDISTQSMAKAFAMMTFALKAGLMEEQGKEYFFQYFTDDFFEEVDCVIEEVDPDDFIDSPVSTTFVMTDEYYDGDEIEILGDVLYFQLPSKEDVSE
ncbi:MAG: hypothetical protein BV459_08245 [Thermoplasmata archaeon M11B2D]|nr:MAG: hypothetical protein BV459_08245 [Thermoplasmata archaeon M11B2D]